jgi:hypothetical protein
MWLKIVEGKPFVRSEADLGLHPLGESGVQGRQPLTECEVSSPTSLSHHPLKGWRPADLPG